MPQGHYFDQGPKGCSQYGGAYCGLSTVSEVFLICTSQLGLITIFMQLKCINIPQ